MNRFSISRSDRYKASRFISPVAFFIFSFTILFLDRLINVPLSFLATVKSRMKVMISYVLTVFLKHFISRILSRNRVR